MAFRLEGLARNVGRHAGGVVIAPTVLTDFSPTYRDQPEGGLMTQYDMTDVEQAGLLNSISSGCEPSRSLIKRSRALTQGVAKAVSPESISMRSILKILRFIKI